MPNINMKNTEDINNEWVNWIENAISKKHIRHYDFKYFNNIKEIGSGGFGKVFRANWKNLENYLALRSFYTLNDVIVKEIVCELKRQRDVDFHNNFIRFYGITKVVPESIIDQSNNYLLVMEYADRGILRDYLKNNFNNLTWNDKFNLAYQLVCAVSCLHDEGIHHHDLHSRNVLIHKNTIRLADFGLSRGISEASTKSALFDMIPYIDPKKFNMQRAHPLHEKSDVYSIGVLLWEISSGKPPFEDDSDISLAVRISQGLRETAVPDTPADYVKLYTECWNGEPERRPFMDEVVKRLKAMISQSNITIYQPNDNISNIPSDNHNDKTEILSLSQNFNNVSVNEIKRPGPSEVYSNVVNDIMIKIDEITNEGKEQETLIFLNHLTNYDINTCELHNWLLDNQDNSNSIFLLGYFNYLGIETIKNILKAFNLFYKASEQNHELAQYYVGKFYESGIGTEKDEDLAFKYFEKIINRDYLTEQLKVSQYYYDIKKDDTKKSFKIAVHWYEKAATKRSVAARNLGLLYLNGNGVDKDDRKAFELFEQSANAKGDECLSGVVMLGNCYYYGIGTNIDYKKAVESYQTAAKLGHDIAQYNLALMYEKGKGIKKDLNNATYWYNQSANQGDQDAQNQLEKLKERDSCKIF